MTMELLDIGDDQDGYAWLDRIACANGSIPDFFVAAGHTISAETRAICRACPVRRECVTHFYNLDLSSGYGGGFSPSQRRFMTLEEALEKVEAESPES